MIICPISPENPTLCVIGVHSQALLPVTHPLLIDARPLAMLSRTQGFYARESGIFGTFGTVRIKGPKNGPFFAHSSAPISPKVPEIGPEIGTNARHGRFEHDSRREASASASSDSLRMLCTSGTEFFP